MMLEDLKNTLETTGLPVAYRAWPERCAPPLPFICYLCTGANNLMADGGVYFSSGSVRVELYTRHKDPAAEAQVEAALQGFHWQKTESYIDSQQCYLILYEIEV